jgi:hypothetical protein
VVAVALAVLTVAFAVPLPLTLTVPVSGALAVPMPVPLTLTVVAVAMARPRLILLACLSRRGVMLRLGRLAVRLQLGPFGRLGRTRRDMVLLVSESQSVVRSGRRRTLRRPGCRGSG